jgi:pimeloyl-ACP methyl ester carboxylesterase
MFRRLLAIGAAAGAFAVPAPAAVAAHRDLAWRACGAAPNVQCATLRAPLDYDRPSGAKIGLFVARSPATDPAHRIGSLFMNFGGPGAPIADFIQSEGAAGFPALNKRFDLIGMDPRGVGQSRPSIDCKADQETEGIYSEPFTTPFNLDVTALLTKDRSYIARCIRRNGAILSHVSTANVARDMDLLRRDLGERKLSYFGFSYGTFLGATYASMFPRNYRAMVLDGPLDAKGYVNTPMRVLAEQTGAFEGALGRFFAACAGDQHACLDFGAGNPAVAFDALIARANLSPLPATGYKPDPRPVTGDDVIAAAVIPLYSKQFWPQLAQALAAAQSGDGTLIRAFSDELFYGRDPATGAFDPGLDRYFLIGATEERYPRGLGPYLLAGARAWAEFRHFYYNSGYIELNYGLYPLHDRDAYYGPFHVPRSSATPLVVATTYDPATPYGGALRLMQQLGNARLLTMHGDGHTAYENGSPSCIDPAIEDYLNTLTLPAEGTSCQQEVPFAQSVSARKLGAGESWPSMRLHGRPLMR